MANIDDTASYIIAHSSYRVSGMQLHKFAFLAQAWSLALRGVPLFPETFVGWAAGPACRALLQDDVAKRWVDAWPAGDADAIIADERVIIDAVLRQYGALTGPMMSKLVIEMAPGFFNGMPDGVEVQISNETIAEVFAEKLLPGGLAAAAGKLETAYGAEAIPAEPLAPRAVDNGADTDTDTVQKGTEGPFDHWEHDHTGLVHVLWGARHAGLTLENDFDEIASRIRGSRWFAANNAKVLETGFSTVQ